MVIILESYYNTTCACVLQGDPLHMGVPTGDVSSILWLLLLQCHAVSSADTAPLLGCSHLTHVFQVHLQQGVFLSVWNVSSFCSSSLAHPLFTTSSPWPIFILQLEGDDRSDEEEEDSDSPRERNHKPSHMNGSGGRGRANGHWDTETEREKIDRLYWMATVRAYITHTHTWAENFVFIGTVKDYT